MRRHIRSIIAASCVFFTPAYAQTPGSVPGMSPASWHEDLRALAKELPKRHANAFHTVKRTSFDSAVAALDARLDNIDDDAAWVGIASIVASIGDGHTSIRLPATWMRFTISPIWFGCLAGSAGPCELHVTSAAPGFERALGARVIAIDGVPVADIHRRLSSTVAVGETDGATWSLSSQYFQSPNVLHGLGVTKSAAGAAFTLADTSGAMVTMQVATAPRGPAALPWATAATVFPESRARPGEPVWWKLMADSQTVYFSFDSYPDKGTLKRQSNELLKFVKDHGARRLVVDLRRNGGGDFTKIREILLPAIKPDPSLMVKGHLYVLIGPNTFSAAMTNAVDFRKDANAILVGLPTGARPNGYQEGDGFTLPRSKLVVGYSTKYYKFQDEDTPGVLPDQRIEPTWEAVRQGRDLALEWVMQQPL